jgi:hypothetical protein
MPGHSRTGSATSTTRTTFRLLHDRDKQLAETEETPFAHRIKPAVYTCVIVEVNQFLSFSETEFFADFASKHSNCAESKDYSGVPPTAQWQVRELFGRRLDWLVQR